MTNEEMIRTILDNPTADPDDQSKLASMLDGAQKYGGEVTEKQGKMVYAIWMKLYGTKPPKGENDAPRSGGSSSGGLGALERIEAKLDLLLKERGLEYGKKAQATREAGYASDAAHNEQGPPPRRSAPAAPNVDQDGDLPFAANWA